MSKPDWIGRLTCFLFISSAALSSAARAVEYAPDQPWMVTIRIICSIVAIVVAVNVALKGVR